MERKWSKLHCYTSFTSKDKRRVETEITVRDNEAETLRKLGDWLGLQVRLLEHVSEDKDRPNGLEAGQIPGNT